MSNERRWVWPKWAKALSGPYRYKGIYGGRGSGKSFHLAERMIFEHVADQNQASVCIREVQHSLRYSVKRLLEQTIVRLEVEPYFRVMESEIRSARGNGRIIFMGMQSYNADNIKSLEGYDRAWIEEAQRLSARSLMQLTPTLRKESSELWFSWNPYLPTDPVDAFFRSGPSRPDAIAIRANPSDNRYFPDVLRKDMEYDRERDPDKYAHVWMGEYLRHSEARVFRNWRIEEFEAPDDAIFRFGADWGFSVDPTVLVRCFAIGNTLYIDHEAYQIGCEIVNTPELFRSIPEAERWPIIADSARPETISHVRNAGFDIRPAVKGARSVEEGIEFLKGYDIVVHPRCTKTIDELTLYAYQTDDLTGQVLPKLDDRHNHVIDSLRYSVEGIRRIGSEINYHRVQKRSSFSSSPIAPRRGL